MPAKVLLVAGEASGDMHGARLVAAMRAQRAGLEFFGIGGERLRAAGMTTLVDTAEVATMGITEVFSSLGRLLAVFRRLVRFLDEEKPDLVVLIDYPDFNLRFAKQAKRRGIPVFYFIGPQIWAWREGRARKIVERVDRIALVFPFEPEIYNRVAGRPIAEFVGHPLLDTVAPTRSRDETRAKYGLDPTKPTLALLPGSRKKEIRHTLAPALAAARELSGQGWQSILARAHTLTDADLREALDGGPIDVPIAVDDTYNVVHAADVAIVASGTATLETALLGRPMVIVYRVSPLSYAIARALVKLTHIGMPNIILGRGVFPELLQEDIAAPKLVAAVQDVASRRGELDSALADLRLRLGEPGAAERAARLALELLR